MLSIAAEVCEVDGFGDLLRIDLTNETMTREEIPLSWRRKYLGGEGINSRLLWEHFLKVDPKIDPRSPDNVLIVGLGPLGATPFGLGSKTKFTFKSPAYNMFGDSVAGAGLGAAMRWAGYDHLIITGRAKRPTCVWIDDDRVVLRDASHLWGRNAHDTERAIKGELGDDVSTACIGRAGENLVGFASITLAGHRTAGRTGGGCVMGSKNLKAIAARGTKGVAVANRTGFLAAMDGALAFLDSCPTIVQNRRREGTMRAIDYKNLIGAHPYRNGQFTVMPDEARIPLNITTYLNRIFDHSVACAPGCQTACSGWHRIRGFESAAAKKLAGETGAKPEFLQVAALGVTTDIRDLPAVMHLNAVCFDYGMDVIEIGSAVSFLMELWERGILTKADLAQWTGQEGSLEWGDWETSERIIKAIGDQSCGLGQLFKDNVYRAAQRIEEIKGIPILKYVNYGKGGGAFTEDQRGYPMWQTNMAVSVRGCDHLRGVNAVEQSSRKEISMEWFGSPEAGEAHGVALKGYASAHAENINTAVNCTGICHAMSYQVGDPLIALAPGLTALTGIPFTGADLYTLGERICNVEKAFNSRLGLRRKDDRVCDRWMYEPAPQGPGKGMKAADYLDQTLDQYYEYRSWDKVTGLQMREKLVDLDLGDVADVLAHEGAVIDG